MKTLFWDTSALMGLVLRESFTSAVKDVWEQADAHYAWRWLSVEASAALSRRRADSASWKELDKLLESISYVELESQEIGALCRMNREWGLRAADAGHLFVFSRLTRVFPDIALVCCDEEMIAAAQAMQYTIWKKDRFRGGLNEPASSYGTLRRTGKTKKRFVRR